MDETIATTVALVLHNLGVYMKIDHVIHWVNERWRVKNAKETSNGYVSPDYRMNETRYCNVRREDDAVSRSVRSNWMKREDNSLDLPFVAYLARRLNTVKAFKIVPRPVDFSMDSLTALLCDQPQDIHMRPGIYTVYPIGGKGHLWSDAYFTNKNYEEFKDIDLRGATLSESYKEIMKFDRVGSFFAGQMLGDLKNTKYLSEAKDWYDWACIGPGSKRGLNRIYENNLESDANNKNFLDRLSRVRELCEPHLDKDIPKLCLQDWQNIMCETDKYLRFYNNPSTGKVYRSNNER
jgi:hypothetical protein